MNDDLNIKEFLNNFVEKYRFLIGAILFILVLASGAILLYVEAERKTDDATKITMLEERIIDLERSFQGVGEELEKAKNTAITSAPQSAAEEIKPTSTNKASPEVKGVSSSQNNSTKPSPPVSGKVNLNTASLSQLDTLPGIGPTYAQRIIEYRESHSGFRTIEEIKQVKGIGEKTFEKFKDGITVE